MKTRLKWSAAVGLVLAAGFLVINTMVERHLNNEPPMGVCRTYETERIKSPDSKVEAILLKQECRDPSVTKTIIYVVATGEKPESDAVFISEQTKGISIKWGAPNDLQVAYSNAKILSFKEKWSSPKIENSHYEVTITPRKN